MKRSKDARSSTGSESGVRTTGRVKKPKTVFDPSDNYMSRSQRVAAIHASSSTQNNAATASVSDSVERDLAANHVAHTDEILPAKPETTAAGMSSKQIKQSKAAVKIDLCIICHKFEHKRGTGAKNKLIACIECQNKTHIFCITSNIDLIDTLRKQFKCQNCRKCDVCVPSFDSLISDKEGEILLCLNCGVCYHPDCHSPRVAVTESLGRIWNCSKCAKSVKSAKSATNENVAVLNVAKPNEISAAIKNEKKETATDKSKCGTTNKKEKNGTSNKTNASSNDRNNLTLISPDTSGEIVNDHAADDNETSDTTDPDDSQPNNNNNDIIHFYDKELNVTREEIKKWSSKQVFNFFKKHAPQEAWVFKLHDIDGRSLLLLRRADIMKRFKLKLGPALRLFQLVLMLQIDKDDVTASWLN